MRRLHEMLDEANGEDRRAELEAVRTRRAGTPEGQRHYAEVLEGELGAVASDHLVVRAHRAPAAREGARAITQEHATVDTKLVKH